MDISPFTNRYTGCKGSCNRGAFSSFLSQQAADVASYVAELVRMGSCCSLCGSKSSSPGHHPNCQPSRVFQCDLETKIHPFLAALWPPPEIRRSYHCYLLPESCPAFSNVNVSEIIASGSLVGSKTLLVELTCWICTNNSRLKRRRSLQGLVGFAGGQMISRRRNGLPPGLVLLSKPQLYFLKLRFASGLSSGELDSSYTQPATVSSRTSCYRA